VHLVRLFYRMELYSVRLLSVPGEIYFSFFPLCPFSGNSLFYLLALAYFFWTCWVGRRTFVLPVMGRYTGSSPLLSLLAGFFPGYLAVLALNRLVTLCVSMRVAPFVLCVAYVVATVWLKRRRVQPRIAQSWSYGDAAAALLLCFSFVYGVQFGAGIHVTGDPSEEFVRFTKQLQTADSSASRLPIFFQHHDELMHLFPLFFSKIIRADADYTFGYWVLMSFARAGGVALLWISLQAMGAGANFAWFLTLILHIGWFFVFQNNANLFDSGNPVFFEMHAGRTLCSLAFFFWMPIFKTIKERERAWSKTELAGIALILLGLASVTISNLVPFTLVAAAFLFLPSALSNFDEFKKWVRWTAPASLLMIFFPAVGYWSDSIYRNWGWLMSLIVPSTFLVIALRTVLRNRVWVEIKSSLANPVFRRFLLVSAISLGIALVFIVNVFVLFLYYKAGVGKLLGIQTMGIRNPFMYQAMRNPFGANPFCHQGVAHCESTLRFLHFYGVAIVTAIAGFLASGRESWMAKAQKSTELRLRYFCLWFGTLLFFCAVAVMDHSNGNIVGAEQYWFKTRFLETWYYPMIGYGIWMLYDSFTGWRRMAILASYGTLTLLPALFSPTASMVIQFWWNLRYLLSGGS
jgi:hypothetical protein